MNVLGVDGSAELHEKWRAWLAPEVQPFFVRSLDHWPTGAIAPGPLSPELRDTYKAWRIDRSLETLWLDEATFFDMSRQQRAALVREQARHRRGAVPSVRRWSDVLDPDALRAQADGRRFVWWPSLAASDRDAVFVRVVVAGPDGVDDEALPSRHREVPDATWQRCAAALPAAQRIAGSFASASGPNCFGTVMAAAGVAGTADEQMVQEPFLAWLDAVSRGGGRDDEAGTVLAWRNGEGSPIHAALTIGDGWALEKSSQEWWTPRAIRTVSDVIRTNRVRGQRLERHRLATGTSG